MSDLNVTTISNSNIAKTDKLLAFNNSDSKAASIQDVVQLAPGVMAVATCSTAGNVATKAVTCADWNNKPGQSILVEFSNANSADNVTLSINSGTAIPVYYMNTATEQVSGGAIPAGAVVFTLNAAGNKFYAHVTKTLSAVDTASNLPVDSGAVNNAFVKDNVKISHTLYDANNVSDNDGVYFDVCLGGINNTANLPNIDADFFLLTIVFHKLSLQNLRKTQLGIGFVWNNEAMPYMCIRNYSNSVQNGKLWTEWKTLNMSTIS